VRVEIRRCCLVPADYRGSTSSEDKENVDNAHCADVNVRKPLRILVAASLSGSVWLGEWKLSVMDVSAMDVSAMDVSAMDVSAMDVSAMDVSVMDVSVMDAGMNAVSSST
jgi:hypothetical protein